MRISRSSPLPKIAKINGEISTQRSNSQASIMKVNDNALKSKSELGNKRPSLKPALHPQNSVHNNLPKTKILKAIQEAAELSSPQQNKVVSEVARAVRRRGSEDASPDLMVLKLEEVVRRTEGLTSSENVDNLASLLASHTKKLSSQFAAAAAHSSLYKDLAISGDEVSLEMAKSLQGSASEEPIEDTKEEAGQEVLLSSETKSSVEMDSSLEHYHDDFIPESRAPSRVNDSDGMTAPVAFHHQSCNRANAVSFGCGDEIRDNDDALQHGHEAKTTSLQSQSENLLVNNQAVPEVSRAYAMRSALEEGGPKVVAIDIQQSERHINEDYEDNFCDEIND